MSSQIYFDLPKLRYLSIVQLSYFISEEKGCEIGIRPVGCFNEVTNARALTEEIYNEVDPSSPVFGGHLIMASNWKIEFPALLCKCARAAKARGYEYFGVNNFGKETLLKSGFLIGDEYET